MFISIPFSYSVSIFITNVLNCLSGKLIHYFFFQGFSLVISIDISSSVVFFVVVVVHFN